MRRKAILAAAAAGATALAVFVLAGPAQAADATVRTTNGWGHMSYDDARDRDLFGGYDNSAAGTRRRPARTTVEPRPQAPPPRALNAVAPPPEGASAAGGGRRSRET